jgi:tetratricopeptide (TPR) repeat protein
MYMERAMWEPALADFNQVVEEKLNIRTVFLHRARIFLVQEKPAKAVESLNLFLAADGKFDPESAAAYEQRGRLLRLLGAEFAKSPSLREGAYDAAMKELHAAVKKDRKTASVFDEMGLLQEKMAEFQKEPKDILARWNLAIVAYSNAIKYDSKDPKLLAKRGNMYIATSAALPPADAVRQLENAKKDFEQALKLDARHAESHALLGYAEAMLKQPSAAQQHATLATMHGAGDYLVLHNVASVYGALSKMQPLRAREHQDMAIPYIRQALELWDKGNRAGPNLLELIDVEIGFPLPLRKRPEFQELIKKYS